MIEDNFDEVTRDDRNGRFYSVDLTDYTTLSPSGAETFDRRRITECSTVVRFSSWECGSHLKQTITTTYPTYLTLPSALTLFPRL